MENNSYAIFNLRRDELRELAQRQLEISETIDGGSAAASAETLTGARKASGVVERLKSDVFNVLVMGCFSSGKSTFLNALLGERVLPSSALPCTGVLTFINYADEANKKIVLYPKKGMGENGDDAPFEISEGDLKKALADSVALPKGCDKEEATETSRYEKAEFFYPLNLCKNGVRIIDSVGLNDPAARDEITLGFAQKADSVIYCMPATAANNMKDKGTISLLDGIGLGDSVFFVLTYFDALKENAENDGEDISALMKSISAELVSRTALKAEGVRFVDSRGALKGEPEAKKRLDDIAATLEKFLVKQKGEMRLKANFEVLKHVNDEAKNRLPDRVRMMRKSVKDIETMMKKTEQPLKNREKECEAILGDLETDGKDITDKVARKARRFFEDMESALPAAIDEYEFESGDLKERGKELSEAVRAFIEKQGLEMQDMLKEEIEPDMERLARNLKRNLGHFSEKIVELRHEVGLDSGYIASLEGRDSVGGWESFSIGTAGGVGMGILGPGFLPVVGVIAGAIWLLKEWRKRKVTKELKEKMKVECEKFFEKSDEWIAQIVGKYSEEIEAVKTHVGKELRAQIEAIRKDIDAALAAQSQDKVSREAEIGKLEALAEDAEKIGRELAAFSAKMKF